MDDSCEGASVFVYELKLHRQLMNFLKVKNGITFQNYAFHTSIITFNNILQPI